MEVSFPWGGRDDAVGMGGSACLMSRLLTKGTDKRSAQNIAEALESVGGSLEPYCGYDYLGMETQTVSEDWPLALEVMFDCLLGSRFLSEQVDKERSLLQASIRRNEDDKFSLTYKMFQKLYYKGHPYSVPPEGERESLDRVTREEVVAVHDRAIRAGQSIVVVVGNVPESDFLDALSGMWAEALGSIETERITSISQAGQGRGELVEARMEIEQACVIMGYPAPVIGSLEATALRLASAMLGEGMSSRLFSRLRDREHLAYSVGASLFTRQLGSHLMLHIGTGPDTLEQARRGLERELNDFLENGPNVQEEKRTRRYILGKYLIGRQTNADLAHGMMHGERLRLGWERAEGFEERLNSISTAFMMQTARAHLSNPAIALLLPNEA